MAATNKKKLAPRNNGAPDYTKMLHPLMTKNYGKWVSHDRLRPGVLVHEAENGDKLYTVRAGSPRTMTADAVRKVCAIADKYSEGFLRFTSRANIEFLLSNKDDLDALINTVENDLGWPLGGTGPSISNIAHTQGWLHCNLPASDAAGAVKAMMDDLIEDFKGENLPNRLRIMTSCCQINCGGAADIGVVVQHHHPPRIDHPTIQQCELPKVVAICPAAAIRPTVVNGKDSVEVIDEKCMYCGACHGQCPSMEIRDANTDTFTIWVGGKMSSARSKPSLMRMAVWGVPNNPPRWPEVSAALRKIIEAYRDDGKPWERLGEWIDRIGWHRFFEKTGFPFTKYHIDDSPEALSTLNRSPWVRI